MMGASKQIRKKYKEREKENERQRERMIEREDNMNRIFPNYGNIKKKKTHFVLHAPRFYF